MKLRKENSLIFFSGIIFLVLFGICSYFNRFAVDDYYHIHNEYVFGIWNGMLEGYNNWGGRWTSYLLFNLIYHFHDSSIILFIYSFAVILLFVFAVYEILFEFISFSAASNIRHSALSLSFLFSIFTFLFSFNKGEMWFWVIATAMYMISLISFLFVLRFILSSNKNIFTYILIILLSIYAGGASEIYAFFYLVILVLLIPASLFITNSPILKRVKETSIWKIILAIVFLSTAFIISVKAPGNTIRASWLNETSFIKTFFITFKELGKIIIFKIIPQFHWAVLFSIPFIYYGFVHGINSDILPIKKIIKPLIGSTVLLFILLYILLFPSCYILSEAGPDRSLSLIVISVTIFISGWSYYIGKRFIKSITLIKKIFYFSTVVIIASLIVISYVQFKTLSKYSESLDKRTEMLKQLQQVKNIKTIAVTPLPSSGYLYSAEISNDTNYFSNEHYRLGLFLDFKVKKE